MSALDEITQVVRTTSAAATPSVVSIGRHGRGTGFVVATDRVLTNAHNLRDRTTQVRFADGRTAQGSVIGSDVDGDLVVLDVDTGDAPPLGVVGARPPTPATSWSRSRPAATRRGRRWGQVTAVNRSFHGPRGRPIAGAVEHTAPVTVRLVRRAGARPRRPGARRQHPPARPRLLPRPLGRPGAARRGGVAGRRAHDRARHARRRARRTARRPRLRQAVGLPERDGLLVRGVVDGSPAAGRGHRERRPARHGRRPRPDDPRRPVRRPRRRSSRRRAHHRPRPRHRRTRR